MNSIRLYLGAHKTATTHLQGILMANRAKLGADGVQLASPQDVRKEWLPLYFQAVRAFGENGRIPPRLSGPLRAAMPAQGDWILTEENIIGVPIELLTQPGIYPNAARRLATLVALFPECKISLHFSLRSYDSFWRSMYSEIVRNRGFLPWDEFYKPEVFAKRSWLDTVTGFVSALPEAEITLWRFEDFRAVMPQALAELSGQSDVDPLIAAYQPEATRPSLSQKAMDILAEIAPALGRAEALRLTERINDHYSVAKGHAPFDPFDAETAAAMRADYARDIDTIRQKFPTLRFLESKSTKV